MQDPLVTNVLATEAMNRARRSNIVLDDVAEGNVAVDAQRKVTFANPAALELLGLRARRASRRGPPLHEMAHYRATGDPVPAEDCVVAEALRTGRTTHRRDHGDSFRRKDGTLFIIERDGEVTGVVVVSDVTKEIEAEIAIGRLAAVVENPADAIVTLANDGSFTHANRAVEHVLGHRPAALVGRTSWNSSRRRRTRGPRTSSRASGRGT